MLNKLYARHSVIVGLGRCKGGELYKTKSKILFTFSQFSDKLVVKTELQNKSSHFDKLNELQISLLSLSKHCIFYVN